MMHKRYSLRTWVFLFLINGLVMCAGFCLLLHQSLSALQSTARDQTEQNLRTFAHALTAVIPQTAGDYDAFLKEIASHDAGFRITLINSSGTVIADSDAADVSVLQNHADRPEVKAALRGEEGKDIHHSTVNKKDVMYYAIPFTQEENHMALRLSMPVDTSVYFTSTVRSSMIFSCSAVFLLILAVSFFVSAHVVRQIKSLQKAAGQYQLGNLGYRPYIQSPRELEELGEDISDMAQTIEKNIQDITVQRDEFQAVFSGTTEALIVFNAKMEVLEYNRAAAEFFDYYAGARTRISPETLAHMVLNSEILKTAESAVRNSTDSAGNNEMQTELHPAAGDRSVLVRCKEIKSSGIERRFLLVLTDITQLKKLEQIRTDFVANVSHELKTPVTSIKGFSETLLDGALDDKDTARHFLEIIDSQSGRLMNIIEDLLTLSRLEQKNSLPDMIQSNITEATKETCRNFEDAASEKQISLTFHADEDTADIRVMMNAGLYEQAAGNIIDNAVKYCPAGSLIECSVQKNIGNTVQIIIQDTGSGIPPQYRDRIFERFFRIDKGRSRETGGTGLGLSITSHIIKIYGGTVKETGRTDGKSGARFVITLPCCQ